MGPVCILVAVGDHGATLTLRGGGGSGVLISDSILGGLKTLFLT